MKVKVCGITSIEDALICANEGADALGFILTNLSPRYIDLEKAEAIIDRLSPFTLKIGVFVNEKSATVNTVAGKLGLNAVQLHGDETPQYVKEITVPVIKSFRVHNKFSFSFLKPYKECVFLLDSYSEKLLGGTGQVFNWKKIPEKLRHNIILAGGVSTVNIENICRNINPGAVDLSSSLESAPGIKDHNKVKEFFRIVNKLRNSKC